MAILQDKRARSLPTTATHDACQSSESLKSNVSLEEVYAFIYSRKNITMGGAVLSRRNELLISQPRFSFQQGGKQSFIHVS